MEIVAEWNMPERTDFAGAGTFNYFEPRFSFISTVAVAAFALAAITCAIVEAGLFYLGILPIRLGIIPFYFDSHSP